MTFCMTFSCAMLAVLPLIISNSLPWICSAPSPPAQCIEPTPWTPADSLSLESLLRGVSQRQKQYSNCSCVKEKRRGEKVIWNRISTPK